MIRIYFVLGIVILAFTISRLMIKIPWKESLTVGLGTGLFFIVLTIYYFAATRQIPLFLVH
jgi:hypothetical protein